MICMLRRGPKLAQTAAAFAAAVMVLGQTASAVQFQEWLGGVDTDWTNAANWEGGVLPTAATDVAISGGALGAGAPAGTIYLPVITTTSTVHGFLSITDASTFIQGAGNLTIADFTWIAGGSTMQVTGGSARLNAPSLNVGYSFLSTGQGVLAVQNGAIATAPTVTVGSDENNTGRVELTGGGSGRGTLVASAVSRGSTAAFVFDGGRLTLSGNNAALFSGFQAGELQIASGGAWIDTQSYAASVPQGFSGGGGFTKEGSGSLTLTGTSSHTGATTIDAGDIVLDGGSFSHPSAAVAVYSDGGVDSALTILNGGSMASSLGVLVGDPTNWSRATVAGADSSWTMSGNLLIGTAGQAELTISDGGVVTTAAVTIGAVPTATGGLSINGSEVAGRGVLATGKITRSTGGGTVSIDGGILRAEADEPDFLAGLSEGDVTIGAGGATIDTAGHDISIEMPLVGTGSLTKTGLGTLRLSTPSSFDGGLTVAAGRLETVDSSVDLSGSGPVVVQSGGTLAGGAFIAGDTTILAGGGLEPEHLFFSGTLDLGGTTSMALDTAHPLAPVSSITILGGDFTQGGTLIADCLDAQPVAGGEATFTLISSLGTTLSHFDAVQINGYLGSGPVSLTRTDSLWSGGDAVGLYEYDETAGTLTITAVPEPAVVALGSWLGITALAWNRRRIRSAASRSTAGR